MRLLIAALFVYVALGITAWEFHTLSTLVAVPTVLLVPIFAWLVWHKVLLVGRWLGEREFAEELLTELERLEGLHAAGEPPDVRTGFEFTFEFERTPTHAAHAFAALRRREGAMRSWVNACVLIVGLLWLGCGIAGAIEHWTVAFELGITPRESALWTLLGCGTVWLGFVRPSRARREYVRAFGRRERVRLRVTDAGIACERTTEYATHRDDTPWSEVEFFLESDRGVGFSIDCHVTWIPRSAFESGRQARALREVVCQRLALAALPQRLAWAEDDDDADDATPATGLTAPAASGRARS